MESTSSSNLPTTVTPLPPDETNNTSTPDTSNLTTIAPITDDGNQSGYPTFWQELFIPIGCFLVILFIFIAVYCWKKRNDEHKRRLPRPPIQGIDNTGATIKPDDNETLDTIETVVLPKPTRRSYTVDTVTDSVRNSVENEKEDGVRSKQSNDSVKPKPRHSDTADTLSDSIRVADNIANADIKETSLELYDDFKLPPATRHTVVTDNNETSCKVSDNNKSDKSVVSHDNTGLNNLEIYEDISLPTSTPHKT